MIASVTSLKAVPLLKNVPALKAVEFEVIFIFLVKLSKVCGYIQIEIQIYFKDTVMVQTHIQYIYYFSKVLGFF